MDKHPFSESDKTGLRAAPDIASRGTPWAVVSEAYLMGFVSENQPNMVHTPAIVEMQRRVTVAARDFNEQSQKQIDALLHSNEIAAAEVAELVKLTKDAGHQADVMVRLTWAIVVLTIILGGVAGVQLWAMLVKGL